MSNCQILIQKMMMKTGLQSWIEMSNLCLKNRQSIVIQNHKNLNLLMMMMRRRTRMIVS